MKKYLTFGWVTEGGGWLIRDTLQEAKDIWAFGRMVFEVDAEEIDNLMIYGREIKSNKKMIEKVSSKYPLVFQENNPFKYLISK